MSKMSELSMMIDTLITCGETLAETGRALKNFYASPEDSTPDAAAPKPEPKAKGKKEPAPEKVAEPPTETVKQYSKEEVRGALARKANESGGEFKTQVKALVKKYGNGGSLTDVPAADYPALVKEVEGLTNA